MKTVGRLFLAFIAIAAIVIAYLAFWPVPISPVAWTPPAPPELNGPYLPNSLLATTERLSLGEGFAPEGIAIDSQDRIYAGFDDGRIIRLQPDGTKPEAFANTLGRPLGMIFDKDGKLIVADANKGLLSISTDGSISTLATESDGVPFRCTNVVDIANDGTIYFSDASNKFPLSNYKADLIEHGANGRLLSYNPNTKTTTTLLSGLSFANGVAVSPDQSFVLVVETGKYRIHRYWVMGPRQGQSDIFIENLPGFPDGLSSNRRDTFWLALVTPRDKTLDTLLPYPSLRKVILRLPKFLQPAPKRYSFVLGLDSNGNVTKNFQNGSPDCYAQIANAVEHDGHLYFGSIGESTIGRYRLPTP
ncbi:MAG TPA: SMP-30/gluconolactonase/LRE family protein [Pyrinomonadaceae bacterium]|nr:SMP-30/gluconolactonase/LRE family protein [Pyrinomonadaceae bacterium]